MNETRNWLITGASSGLGLAVARAVHNAGDRVAATVRNVEDAHRLETAMPGLVALIGDLSDPTAADALVAQAQERLGAIDVLVNNAGRGFAAAIEEADDAEIAQLFDLNVFAPVRMIRAVLPAMRARRSGLVINITSISGFKPWSGTGFYCATKFAMEGIGQTLAQEVAGFGIRVINVQPGGLRTDFNGRSLSASERVIPDYGDSAHIARRALSKADGKQEGDPKRAAEVIVAVSRLESPPLNLLLGRDALAMCGERLARITRDMADWAPAAASIAFPD